MRIFTPFFLLSRDRANALHEGLSTFMRNVIDHSVVHQRDETDRFSVPSIRRTRKILERIHEQLPLPVPCYDLLPVIELALGLHERRRRALPTPLS